MLRVRDLKTHLHLKRGVLKAVDGVSFDLAAGETLGLIGESGSGKTMTGLSLLGLPPKPAGRIVGGTVELDGRELVDLDERTMAAEVRGRQIAMISQDPMTPLQSGVHGWRAGGGADSGARHGWPWRRRASVAYRSGGGRTGTRARSGG